jgi:UDP-N-acetyl-D-mannosaminuronic acid transferase (WecB/TagA/CpsF family)
MLDRMRRGLSWISCAGDSQGAALTAALGGKWLFRLMKEPKRVFMRYVVGKLVIPATHLIVQRGAAEQRQ